jgi:hypothetical protein
MEADHEALSSDDSSSGAVAAIGFLLRHGNARHSDGYAVGIHGTTRKKIRGTISGFHFPLEAAFLHRFQ